MSSIVATEYRMTTFAKPAIIDRQEPIFGVCEALGDDFGVNPNWFRAALAPLIFWNPIATLVGYFAVGLVVLAVRLLVPDVTAPVLAVPAVRAEPEESTEPDELRLAA